MSHVRLAALLGALVLSGCLSTPNAPSFRWIETLPPQERFEHPAASHPVRLVEIASHEAARDVLAWRARDGSIRRVEGVRWSDQPTDTVRRLALERIAASPTLDGAPRRLSIELLAFGGVELESGVAACVRAFVVVEDVSGALVRAEVIDLTEALPGTAADLARGDRSLCEALGRLAVELVDRVVGDVGSEGD